MHGLVNRAIQCFIRDMGGPGAWEAVADAADLPRAGFEAVFLYEDALTDRMIAAGAARLGKPEGDFLEDLGIYLVSHPSTEALRRLLRFGGATFVEFLQSLDDLPRRARLAVPDLDLPALDVHEHAPDRYTIEARWPHEGAGLVLAGMIRALADDYGALVLLDHGGRAGGCETMEVRVLEGDFATGRPFALSPHAASGGAP